MTKAKKISKKKTVEAKKPKAKKAKTSKRTEKTKKKKITVEQVYEVLLEKIDKMESRINVIEKQLSLQKTPEMDISQHEFDNLVYQSYLQLRERPKQSIGLIKIWQEISLEENISWESFSKLMLNSQDSRFRLAEGKSEHYIEDKSAKRYYSSLIGSD